MSEYLSIWLKLGLAMLLFAPAIVYQVKGDHQKSVVWLVIAATGLRLVMITLDPFLHDWDERYHALVAKHLMDHPFVPILRETPILPYDFKMWCCNHIWLHKQPLFMWQMALSMKAVGVGVVGVRLPDVIMGGLAVYFTYRIALIWTGLHQTAWLGALLYASSNFFLELSSGRYALDHNDLTFSCYATAAIWAFCEYTQNRSWKYAALIGLLAGASILVKWLTGLLPFGGWLVFLLLDRADRAHLKNYGHLALAVLVCAAVFAPWQWYIQHTFPQEAAWEYAYNQMHIDESLGHGKNDALFHLRFLDALYGGVFLPFMALGAWRLFSRPDSRRMSVAMFSMIAVVYAFFSLYVATKMGGFTVPVAALMCTLVGAGLDFGIGWFGGKTNLRFKPYLPILFIAILAVSLKPWAIASSRNTDKNSARAAKMHNTEIYRNLQTVVSPDEVIINCKELEDVDLMFWQPNNAYQWCPTPEEVQDLVQKGYKIAAFKSHTNQGLPEYVRGNPAIKIIELELK
jgi:4-amino-4-deoxy-L-arabinose transferase